jgi:hypothetical protein
MNVFPYTNTKTRKTGKKDPLMKTCNSPKGDIVISNSDISISKQELELLP